MSLKKGYQRIKKVDILKWLREGNAIVYVFILVVFIAAVVFMFNTVGSMFNNQTQQEETLNTESKTYVADNKSYKISINKGANFITIYKIDSNGEFTIAYKTFRCSVNSNVKTGETVLSEKYMWRRLSEGVYGHYTSRLANSAYIHSVPFSSQNNSTLIVDAYNRLGNEAAIGSIYMDTADTKWIYENCGVETKVEIYDDTSEKPAIELKQFTKVSADTKYDPTDEMRVSDTGNVHTRIDYMTGVNNCTINVGEDFDRWEGVYAVDIEGNDITSDIKITGELDTSTPGNYVLIYNLSDDFGTDLAYWRYITVTDEDSTSETEAETETEEVTTESNSKQTKETLQTTVKTTIDNNAATTSTQKQSDAEKTQPETTSSLQTQNNY